VLSRQQSIQTEILADIPSSVIQASHDQIAELKRGFKANTDALARIENELRQIREAA
jgi:hypothetical protein